VQRRDAIGLGLLVPGFVAAYAAFVLLGTRVFPTATIARDNGMEHAAVYFLGVEGDSPAVLALVLGWIALGVVGAALVAAGQRLIATASTREPRIRPHDEPAVWHRFDV
jgi:hypothetical protein